ncbi:MAG: efflux RND transporter periplasmic adaptor subunit [Chitinophagaceae bacterium]|nr:efflux RND transporter periplasmic adaptor subunit [Chitinophagaceae bacterium]
MSRQVSILILCSSLAILSCQDPRPAPASATPVNLAVVKSQPVLYYDDYPATTQALSQVDLHAQVTGYITGIYFNEGSHVHKGEKLYAIDERLYQAAYDQAAANVQVAEGNQKQAQQDADRYEYLNQHNAVARQVLDHAEIALQNAKNEVAAARQALKTAATNLTYSIITAPFDGTVGFSQVKLGNLVTVGATTLTTISTDEPMAVDFLANEAQLPQYEDLQRTKQKEPDSLFTIIMPGKKLYPYSGKISVIDRAVDPQTGTIRIRLVFPNPRNDLRAGMSCVLRVHNLEPGPQITIPGKAVVEQMGEYFVFIARDSAAHLMAMQVKVEEGKTIGSNVIITKGLKEGDRIVVDGVQALHDGSAITTANKRGPAAAGGRGK